MKDVESFSKWMEENLDEAINKCGCETCGICFILPEGGTMTAFYAADYADKKAIAAAFQEDVMDHFVRENMPMWIERMVQDTEEPEDEEDEQDE